MKPLSRDDLYSLEKYAEIKNDFRSRVIAHKKQRTVPIGEHAALYFEDTLTIQYQVQEMLRLERIFKADAIQEELDVYNPLIPDGSNLKATFMLEYIDVAQRKQALARLIGIEDSVWIRVDNFDKVYAIANEDLPAITREKTSAVHFLRFELTAEMVAGIKQEMQIRAGIDHSDYRHETIMTADTCKSLACDLL